MPDIPESAISAAAEAIGLGMTIRQPPATLARAALEVAAPLLAEAWGVKRREPSPTVRGLTSANAERTSRVGHRDAERARLALVALGDRCNDRMRAVAEARIAQPEASWKEIGASLGMTKDQAASLFGRLMHRLHIAQQREEASRA